MSYRDYKAAEENLKKRYHDISVVSVEPIDPADVYYTDGDASASICKVIYPLTKTVYIPQLIYIVSDVDREILSHWIDYVKGLNKTN